ncbi:hypothetical protein [Bacillus tianshenii]|nr:hypothetical protein [Bacillus tianshenii]
MEKERLAAVYMLWALIVIIELWWLHSVSIGTNDTASHTFAVTVIAATLVMGAVGLNLLGKSKGQK